jgi:hypothetical protein
MSSPRSFITLHRSYPLNVPLLYSKLYVELSNNWLSQRHSPVYTIFFNATTPAIAYDREAVVAGRLALNQQTKVAPVVLFVETH